jgi:hypothetical protein
MAAAVTPRFGAREGREIVRERRRGCVGGARERGLWTTGGPGWTSSVREDEKGGKDEVITWERNGRASEEGR